MGLWLYDILAGNKNIGHPQWLNKSAIIAMNKNLNSGTLRVGFVFYDGQMLDYELGCWIADEARNCKVGIKEHHAVTGFDTEGKLWGFKGENTWAESKDNVFSIFFDLIINATGSYTEQILIENGIKPKYRIDHVRGSHLVIDRTHTHGYFLEVSNDKRIIFVLPYKEQTLIGTTE
jgi:glycerol-3-phosphate dehydrogenase